MARPEPEISPHSVNQWVRSAEPPVHYDVEAGLARHRQLVGSEAGLPEWAEHPPGGAIPPWARWLGALAVVGGLAALLVWPPAAPQSVPEAAGQRSLPPRVAPPSEPRGPVPGVSAPPTGSKAPEAATPPGARPAAPSWEAPGDARPPSANGMRASAPAQEPAAAAPSKRREPGAGAASRRPRRAAAARPRAQTPRPGAAPEPPPSSAQPAAAGPGPATARGGGAAGEGDVRGVAPHDGEEIQLLARARRMLRVDPLRTLRLVREAEQRFGEGYLRQERRYVEIQALRALGRDLEADARADWFLQDYPQSPYASEVQNSSN